MDWRIQMGDIYNFFVCLSSMYFIYFQFNLRNVSAVDWRIQTGDIDKWFNSETRTRNRDNEGGSTLKMLKGIFKTIFWIVFVNIRPEVKRRRRKNTFFDRWANMDVLRSMLCWYKKEIRQWMHGLHNTYNVIQCVQVISFMGGPDYIFSNIIVHSRICESYNLKQSYVEVIRKRLGSECKEGSWAIVQSGVTLENHRLLCPLLDIYTTYYIFLQKKKIESSLCNT